MANAISDDGRWMAVSEYKNQQWRIALWNLTTGKQVRSLAIPSLTPGPVVLSPDGKRLATAANNPSEVKLWETPTGKQIATLPGDKSTDIRAVAFSADGKLLAAGSYEYCSAKVWEVSTARELRAFPAQLGVTAVAFDPSGELLAADANGLRVWDITAGKQVAFIQSTSEAAQNFPATTLTVSPDGRWVAANPNGTLRVREMGSWEPLDLNARGTEHVYSMTFGPPRRPAASVGSGMVRSWQIGYGEQARTLWGSTYAMTVSPDGKLLAAAHPDGGEVGIWDTASGQKLHTIPAHKLGVNYLAFSPNGALLLTGGQDTRITPEDVSSGQVSLRGTIKIWDTSTWSERRSFPLGAGPSFSPDSRLIAFSLPGVIQVWNLNEGVLVRTLANKGWATGNLAFSPDGRWLVQGGVGITVWRVAPAK